ncbi:MAG: helix-turn-helix domain-containing protein [Sulfurovaceae bacterium]
MTEVKLERVLDYLIENGSGSKKEIRQATHYDNVGDAIRIFRNRGYDITTTWASSSTGARYAIYVLKSKPKAENAA